MGEIAIRQPQVPSTKPGVSRFQVTNGAREIEHLYPGDQTDELISLYYVIRDSVKRERPEQLQEKITAVFSGNMKPSKMVKTIAELID